MPVPFHTRGPTRILVREIYFVKYDDSSRTEKACDPSQGRCGIGLVEQNIAAHNRVERCGTLEIVEVYRLKLNEIAARVLCGAFPCTINTSSVPVDSKNATTWTDQLTYQKRDIAQA